MHNEQDVSSMFLDAVAGVCNPSFLRVDIWAHTKSSREKVSFSRNLELRWRPPPMPASGIVFALERGDTAWSEVLGYGRQATGDTLLKAQIN